MNAIRCKCTLADCHYHHPVADGKPDDCDCTHEDKQYYPGNPCPLYKKVLPHDAMKELTKRFLRKR